MAWPNNEIIFSRRGPVYLQQGQSEETPKEALKGKPSPPKNEVLSTWAQLNVFFEPFNLSLF